MGVIVFDCPRSGNLFKPFLQSLISGTNIRLRASSWTDHDGLPVLTAIWGVSSSLVDTSVLCH